MISQCIWWCDSQGNNYDPPHRCDFTTDLKLIKGKLLCRCHRAFFLKTGKVPVKPKK